MDTTLEVLQEIKPFAGASGTCDSVVALDFLNKGRRLLWNKTDYHETMDYFAACCAEGCFFLPSAYKQIRLAWACNQPLSIGDEWYSSVPQVRMPSPASSMHRNIVQVGGFHVTFQNYYDAPYQVAIQAEHPKDVGASIKFFAVDENGTSRSETLLLENPPNKTLSKYFYQHVTAVIKPRTVGRIRLYAVDKQASQFLLLAIYQPYDKNPQFRKFSLPRGANRLLTVYAKKSYFDLIGDDELVEFPTEALKFAVIAISSQLDRDLKAYGENLGAAITECNSETGDNEIPTASPMRFLHNDHPEHLISY